MNDDARSKVSQLRIDPAAKRRSTGAVKLIFVVVALAAVGAVALWRPWEPEGTRVVSGGAKTSKVLSADAAPRTATGGTNQPAPAPTGVSNSVLTVSGYIINRERIEISPRFMGVVKWIGVKKGDAVTNGQVVVLLDDAEYQARKSQIAGRIAQARVQVRRAEVELTRITELVRNQIESQRVLDLATLDLEAARADVRSLEGELQLMETYLDWCVIRAPHQWRGAGEARGCQRVGDAAELRRRPRPKHRLHLAGRPTGLAGGDRSQRGGPGESLPRPEMPRQS
jgi:multidrug efflux pump subunit AcrA (membrane-fusion protein)